MDKAEKYLFLCEAGAAERDGEGSHAHSLRVFELALLQLENRKLEEAAANARKYIKFRKNLNSARWRIEAGGSLLGEILHEQNQNQQAEIELLAAQKGFATRGDSLGENALIEYQATLRRLVGFYSDTKRESEAAKWRKKLEDLGREN